MRRWAAIALAGFVAVTGIVGGVAVATGVDEFPPEWLEGTPFPDYTVPGVLLAVAVGGSAAVALIALLLRSPWAPALTVVAGAILMGWIVGEVLILNQPVEPTWIEIAFFGIGMAMSVLGIFARGRRPAAAPAGAVAGEEHATEDSEGVGHGL
jgi:hypothetical protein